MINTLRPLWLVVPLALSSSLAYAQTTAGPIDEVRSARAHTRHSSSWEQSQNPAPQRDSLWNGVIVGAGAGTALGLLTGNALIDCSECAGFNVPLTFGVLGAGIGAVLGATLDAHRVSRPTPQRGPQMQLAPLLAKETRGLMAWIRF